MAELWAPFATRRDGPAAKRGYTGNLEGPKAGVVYHSAEGHLPVMLSMLDNHALDKSWTFSNPRDGPLLQHYNAREHTWCNGSYEANAYFVSCESEGLVGQALSPSQVDNLVALTAWLGTVFAWPRLKRREQLWEHNEMTRFGAAYTACPSGRIPWAIIIERATEEMSELEDLRNQVKWWRAVAEKWQKDHAVAKAYLEELARRRTEHLKIEGVTEG